MDMNDERRPGFQLPGRRNFWLLPLIVGLGMGALLFGLLPAVWGEFGDRHEGGARAGMYAQPERQQEQGDDDQQPGPANREQDEPRFRGEENDREWGHGETFSWFNPERLVVPLLLIGAGAWLLSGRRRAPGGSTGLSGRQAVSYDPSPSPAPREPYSNDPESPTTGETRRLL